MLFNEILRLALSSLLANKLRSGLTMLGIAVGVFSVIGVMTVITGLRGSIESGLNVLGANSFQITKFPAINFSDPSTRFRNRRDITYAQADRFKEMMRDRYQIVYVDVGTPQLGKGRNLDIAKRFGIGKVKNTPLLIMVSAEGKLLNSKKDAASWRNAASRNEDDIYRYFATFTPV